MRRALVFGTILLAAKFAFLASPAPAAPEPRLNVILLLADDQRWDTLGATGNPIIQTPHLDRLAAGGVVFDQAFVTTSICAVNRACILTGQYAARHGVLDFSTSLTPDQLAESYPGVLKKAGYWIGFIGKWGVGQPPKGFFDYDRAWPGQSYYFHDRDGKKIHLTQILGDQAVEFLETAPAERPFCLSVSFKAPHVQDSDPKQFLPDPQFDSLYRDVTIPLPPLSDPAFFDRLPEFLKTSENRVRWEKRFATPEAYQESVKNYYRLITGLDYQVGRIVATLKERGLDKNTVILFHGDNGFYLGERGFAGKWFPHDVSIHVPLIINDPRLPASRRGTHCNALALSIDLAPTILALADCPVPARMQGRSLVPWLEGETPPWRTEFFYEHLFSHPRIPRSEAVRDEHTKYIRYVDQQPVYEELYDLQTDPNESDNLATKPEYKNLLEQMRAKWRALRKAAQ